ncbi:hypothetical protein [Acidisoma sp. S159]|uniref:hypothetical protein n=1 Tax=Acidisoma sp. S159 TaxID=1747225 RepID=UPI00131C2CB5|nr:hypothetical protein [Acidisoma sp. S159]
MRDLQMPLVMDVTQVSANLIVQGSLTASIMGLGAVSALSGAGPAVPTSATAGSLSTRVVPSTAATLGSSLEYEENPTITYTPLTGQPLIAQLTTPITVDSLASLPDSDWPLPGILEMATHYLTPNFDDKDLAINSLIDLDSQNVLRESVGKSPLSATSSQHPSSGTAITQQLVQVLQPSSPPSSDSLIFYLNSSKADAKVLRQWSRLINIYWPTQPEVSPSQFVSSAESQKFTTQGMAATLTKIKDQLIMGKTKDLIDLSSLPNMIELRTTPVALIAPAVAIIPSSSDQTPTCNAPFAGPQSPLKSHCLNISPVLRTNSAIGVLLTATDPQRPLIEFVSPNQYRTIRALSEYWNNGRFAPIHHPANSPATATKPRPASWPTVPFFYTIPDFFDKPDFYNPLFENSNRYFVSTSDADPPGEERLASRAFVACYIRHSISTPLLTVFPDNDKLEDNARFCYQKFGRVPDNLYHNFTDPYGPAAKEIENSLELSRRYILIITSATSPQEALPEEPIYVSFRSNGVWYFISSDDDVSKRNFALISEFMSIMAIPSQTPQPTPTIGVGGNH